MLKHSSKTSKIIDFGLGKPNQNFCLDKEIG
jgi:hypothetical protein